MPGIICAIRGGPASRKTMDRAIKLAGENELALLFLYVVNLDFLSHTASSRIKTITEEMREMGEFILLGAQERAQKQGIAAQTVVRQGVVSEEIIDVCRQAGADYLVLGQPAGQDEEEDIFTQERLLAFSQRIEAESGAKVILVEEEARE